MEEDRYYGRLLFYFRFYYLDQWNLNSYLQIACELEEWQAYLVTFAFYVSILLWQCLQAGYCNGREW